MYTLTAFSPAAFTFCRMSSHKEGTGRRKVWNSPELREIHSISFRKLEDLSLQNSLKKYSLPFDY